MVSNSINRCNKENNFDTAILNVGTVGKSVKLPNE